MRAGYDAALMAARDAYLTGWEDARRAFSERHPTADEIAMLLHGGTEMDWESAEQAGVALRRFIDEKLSVSHPETDTATD